MSLHSEVLGLDLHLYPDLGFRFFDPISNQILRSYAEAEHDRLIAELERSYEQQARREAEVAQQQAEAIATQERLAKQAAEAIATQATLAQQQAEQKAQRLAEMLKAMGIDTDEI